MAGKLPECELELEERGPGSQIPDVVVPVDSESPPDKKLKCTSLTSTVTTLLV